jgi:D-sedoheptulose 7-phosphate isomerase
MDSQMIKEIRAQIAASIAIKQEMLADAVLLDKLAEIADVCIAAFRRGNRVILAGNGGSAADAQHIAAEFVSRFEFDRPGLPSIALTTDTSMLTAIGNDYGFERLFLRQLEANGRSGDVFIGISTSGNSKNILLALEHCRRLGITSVGLTGEVGAMHSTCDYLIAVPSSRTARIQEAHILVGHIICGLVESTLFKRAEA